MSHRIIGQLQERLKQTKSKCEKYEQKHGLFDDLVKIIKNENLKDFTVRVNDEEFKVHKLILAARSPVLKDMIENNIDAESLNLVDISKETFREILNFMYTDELRDYDGLNFFHLYAAAERLKIEILKNYASKMVEEKINEKNAFEVLTLANKFGNKNLKYKSFEKIKTLLGVETGEISSDLASNPEKLRDILVLKQEKDEMMRHMNLEMVNLLKNK